ncbi:MAG: hypothetical protein QM749_12250 [Aquabacterium sp.]
MNAAAWPSTNVKRPKKVPECGWLSLADQQAAVDVVIADQADVERGRRDQHAEQGQQGDAPGVREESAPHGYSKKRSRSGHDAAPGAPVV